MTLFFSDGFLNKLTRVGLKKHFQKKKIVRTLYLNGPLSQAEIISFLEVSAPKLQGLLEELINEGIIEIRGSGSSKGGRPPVLYGLKKNAFFVLSIHIGKYVTDLALFNSTNKQVKSIKKIALPLKADYSLIEKIYDCASKLIEESGIDESRILGVGIDMPGLVDSEAGINHNNLNFEKPVRDLFAEKFGKPVVIENDAKARALAEFRFGKAKGKKNVLVLYLSWGIGMGMILNGKPYRGARGLSGEFAHIPMTDERAYLCSCGKRGCLETVASGSALTRMAKEALENGEMTLIKEMANNNAGKITQSLVLEAAKRGDQFAISIISKVGFDLGKGISSLVQILNPEMIILSGPLANAGSYLTTSIEQALQQYTFAIMTEDLEITLSELKADANLLGNVINVMENIFEN